MEYVVSIDESGISDMAMTGLAAQIIPELDGRGPVEAVMAIGDSFLKDTPFIDTSVGELISKDFTEGGAGGGRGWFRG